MVGVVPKVKADIRADWTKASGARGRALRIALISALVPLSLTLVQCGKAPNPAALAANSQANVPVVNQTVAKTNLQVASSDTFEDRFPAPQFRERFPAAIWIQHRWRWPRLGISTKCPNDSLTT